MLPILALGSPIDGAAAAVRAKALLQAFDVAGPYYFAGVRWRKGSGYDTGGWMAGFVARHGRCGVMFRKDGRVWVVDDPANPGGQIENPKDPGAAGRVAGYLAHFRPPFPVRAAHSQTETSVFYFAGLVKGYPIV